MPESLSGRTAVSEIREGESVRGEEKEAWEMAR